MWGVCKKVMIYITCFLILSLLFVDRSYSLHQFLICSINPYHICQESFDSFLSRLRTPCLHTCMTVLLPTCPSLDRNIHAQNGPRYTRPLCHQPISSVRNKAIKERIKERKIDTENFNVVRRTMCMPTSTTTLGSMFYFWCI